MRRRDFCLFALLLEMLFECSFAGEDGIYLVVEVFDHDLRFEVDLIIVLRTQSLHFGQQIFFYLFWQLL